MHSHTRIYIHLFNRYTMKKLETSLHYRTFSFAVTLSSMIKIYTTNITLYNITTFQHYPFPGIYQSATRNFPALAPFRQQLITRYVEDTRELWH